METYERVKAVREELQLSQKAFANKLSSAQTYISILEKGNRPITKGFMNLLYHTFGVNIKWLETGEGEMFSTVKVKEIEADEANKLNDELLTLIFEAVEQYLNEREKTITPKQRAKLTTTLYAHFAKTANFTNMQDIRKQLATTVEVMATVIKTGVI